MMQHTSEKLIPPTQVVAFGAMRSFLTRLSTTRLVALAALALLGAGALAFATDPHGLRQYDRLSDELSRLEDENAALKAQVELGRRRVRALHGDDAALERVAREMGYVRDGELLFELR